MYDQIILFNPTSTKYLKDSHQFSCKNQGNSKRSSISPWKLPPSRDSKNHPIWVRHMIQTATRQLKPLNQLNSSEAGPAYPHPLTAPKHPISKTIPWGLAKACWCAPWIIILSVGLVKILWHWRQRIYSSSDVFSSVSSSTWTSGTPLCCLSVGSRSEWMAFEWVVVISYLWCLKPLSRIFHENCRIFNIDEFAKSRKPAGKVKSSSSRRRESCVVRRT